MIGNRHPLLAFAIVVSSFWLGCTSEEQPNADIRHPQENLAVAEPQPSDDATPAPTTPAPLSATDVGEFFDASVAILRLFLDDNAAVRRQTADPSAHLFILHQRYVSVLLSYNLSTTQYEAMLSKLPEDTELRARLQNLARQKFEFDRPLSELSAQELRKLLR